MHQNDIIIIYPFNEGENSRADDYFKHIKTKRYILDEKTIKVKGNTVSVQNSGISCVSASRYSDRLRSGDSYHNTVVPCSVVKPLVVIFSSLLTHSRICLAYFNERRE